MRYGLHAARGLPWKLETGRAHAAGPSKGTLPKAPLLCFQRAELLLLPAARALHASAPACLQRGVCPRGQACHMTHGLFEFFMHRECGASLAVCAVAATGVLARCHGGLLYIPQGLHTCVCVLLDRQRADVRAVLRAGLLRVSVALLLPAAAVKYKTKMCRSGEACKRHYCFFW